MKAPQRLDAFNRLKISDTFVSRSRIPTDSSSANCALPLNKGPPPHFVSQASASEADGLEVFEGRVVLRSAKWRYRLDVYPTECPAEHSFKLILISFLDFIFRF